MTDVIKSEHHGEIYYLIPNVIIAGVTFTNQSRLSLEKAIEVAKSLEDIGFSFHIEEIDGTRITYRDLKYLKSEKGYI